MKPAAFGAGRARVPAWLILAGGCGVVVLTFGLRYSFGVFIVPVSLAMGWGRDVFSLAIALQNLCWGLAQPVAGALADRHGMGRVLCGGALLFALALAGTSLVRTPLELYLLLGVVAGVAQGGCGLPLIVACFGRLFPPARCSQAIGLATAASSAGQLLLVPLVQLAVSGGGWQAALWMMASVTLAVPFLGLPLAVASRGKPAEATPGFGPGLGATLRGALVDPSYLLLLCGFFVCGFHVTFIVIHLPPYLADLGLAPVLGAWAVGVIGLFNIAGSWLAGLLGGRYSRRLLLCGLYAARAVVLVLFLLLPISSFTVLAFAAGMGLLWLGTIPLTSGLVMVRFGTCHFATLFGVVFLAHQVGAFLGVWLGGLLHRWSGGYEAVWWLAVLLGVAAVLVHWPIQERRVAWVRATA